MHQEKFQPRWEHASVDLVHCCILSLCYLLTMVRFCHRQIYAMFALSHLPTFYHKYFDYERVDDVVTNSEEKTAPPFMERLQKGTVCKGKYPPLLCLGNAKMTRICFPLGHSLP